MAEVLFTVLFFGVAFVVFLPVVADGVARTRAERARRRTAVLIRISTDVRGAVAAFTSAIKRTGAAAERSGAALREFGDTLERHDPRVSRRSPKGDADG